jgi:hypothetical protein
VRVRVRGEGEGEGEGEGVAHGLSVAAWTQVWERSVVG